MAAALNPWSYLNLNTAPSTVARPPPWRSRRRTRVALAAVLAVVLTVVATTRMTFRGRLYGLYLLESEFGRPFELKDDLMLGDGPRLIAGVSFSALRELLSRSNGQVPRLDVEWDEEDGGGFITNYLDDGRALQTVFGRYVDDEGRNPQGVFVGGAVAEVASGVVQNQSGMALRDARGWHHIWCNVNELLVLTATGRVVFPGEWKFLGSRLLANDPRRAVIQSEHEVKVSGVHLRMERFGYFKAGSPWFRLGINIVNLGEEPVPLSFGYGDEPWVGEFGSAEGNIGWTDGRIAPTVSWIDMRTSQWGGILDTRFGLANFVSWVGSAPDLAYFGNHPGTPSVAEFGEPLASNEVFIGLEWRNRRIDAGETLSLRLTLGLATTGADGLPVPPAGAVNPQ